jgi:type IV secretory pathway TrbD component
MRVYTSLTRSKLRNGCDYRLNALNVMVCICFAFTCLHHLRSLWVPIVIYYTLRTLFRWTAQVDPEWISVYTAALQLKRIFYAGIDPRFREKKPRRVLFKRPRWSV